MRLRDILTAVLVAAFWGFNFVVVKLALASFPPLLLAALRFAVAALPVLVVARPDVPWPLMLAIGLSLFVVQFGCLFAGIAAGMPPGLAAVVLQAQAFFTILIAAVALCERPRAGQVAGTLFAAAGLVLIAATLDRRVAGAGLALTLAGAFGWGVGNVLLRRAGKVDMFAMTAWLSLVPPLPLLALSALLEGPHAIGQALGRIGWPEIGAVLYLAAAATTIGYGLWGRLLRLYAAATVAPLALLVPVFAALSSALVLGERFGPMRLLGMALVAAGLAVVLMGPETTGRAFALAKSWKRS